MNDKPFSAATSARSFCPRKLTSEGLGVLCWHCPQVLQIALVPHEHNDNVGVGVVAKLLKPALNVLVGRVLGNVVYKKGTHSAAVVCRSDGAVAFLSGCMVSMSFV